MIDLDRLDVLLRERGWSRSELLRRLGLTAGMFERWKRGQSSPDKHLPRMCAVLGVRPEELGAPAGTSIGRRAGTVPVLGVIRAGLPILAEENMEGEVEIDSIGADFALRVAGESMVYAGIYDGDLVLLRQTDRAMPGQIVAAVAVDDFGSASATLKYFVRDRVNGDVLRAANPEFSDVPMTRSHHIIGVFAGLLRTEEPLLRDVASVEARAGDMGHSWSAFMHEASAAGVSVDDLYSVLNLIKKVGRE